MFFNLENCSAYWKFKYIVFSPHNFLKWFFFSLVFPIAIHFGYWAMIICFRLRCLTRRRTSSILRTSTPRMRCLRIWRTQSHDSCSRLPFLLLCFIDKPPLLSSPDYPQSIPIIYDIHINFDFAYFYYFRLRLLLIWYFFLFVSNERELFLFVLFV